jgi:effector-binding domain-containing protein
MKLGKVMGPAYMEIMESMKKQGIEVNEKNIPFTKYKNIQWDSMNKKGLFAFIHMMFFQKWDMDIGIPCTEQAKAEGRIQKIKLEKGKFLRAMHVGPYMKVGDTYNTIRSFAADKNLKLSNYSLEFYLNDPRETPAAELKTEVFVPVI